MHYDNPNNKPGIYDTSGLTVHAVRHASSGLVETNQLIAGIGDGLLGQIPQGQKSYHMTITIPSAWINSPFIMPSMAPEQPWKHTALQDSVPCGAGCGTSSSIEVFAAGGHMHKLGRKMWVSLLDEASGTEDEFFCDANYDFDLQDTTYLQAPKTIPPGKGLVVHCVFDSSTRTVVTNGGEGTFDEMCLINLLYRGPPSANIWHPTTDYPNFGGLGAYPDYKTMAWHPGGAAPFTNAKPTWASYTGSAVTAINPQSSNGATKTCGPIPPPALPPAAPWSPSPPPPGGGGETVTVFEAVVDMTAAGDVSSFDESKKADLARRFANKAGVAESDVTVEVTSASVRINIRIRTASANAASSVASTLSTELADTAKASAFTGVSVTAVTTVVTHTIHVPAPSPPLKEPAKKQAEISDGAVVAIALISGLITMLSLAGVLYWLANAPPTQLPSEATPLYTK